MSHTRVKTKYQEQVDRYLEERTLYCHHNHSADIVSFYGQDGYTIKLCFDDTTENNLWDAINRLIFPYKDKWGDELLEDVEYYNEGEIKINY